MPITRAVALLSFALPTAGAAAPAEEIILSLRVSGALRVPVTVNGAGPFSFLLDTGSSHTIVGSELVDRLGLPVVAQARVVTPAGVEMGPVVSVERLSIGSASVSGLMPSVISLAELHAAEPGLDGVLGQDFLKQFDYTIDYRRERLRFTADFDDEHVRLSLVRAGDRSLVQLQADTGDEPVLMVPTPARQGS